MVYDSYQFTRDGRISKKALENVWNFLVEYGVVKKERAPALEELHTSQFTS